MTLSDLKFKEILNHNDASTEVCIHFAAACSLHVHDQQHIYAISHICMWIKMERGPYKDITIMRKELFMYIAIIRLKEYPGT